MLRKTLTSLVVGIVGLCASASSQAVNLMDVYHQALTSDPTFQAARSQWLSDKENLNISITDLLPSLDVQGSYTPSYVVNNVFGKAKNRYKNETSIIDTTVTEPIFDYAGWAAIRSADASAKGATATFSAAAQDLIVRVATAYFNVLQAYDDLKFTEAEKKAIGRQLEQTQERYKVGLIAITDVYETKAKYESVIAQEIAAKNTLANTVEDLQEITGHNYRSVTGIKDGLPLITPKPKNINAWAATATRQNYTLLAARFTSLAAKHLITQSAAARYPTVTLDGGFNYSFQNNASDAGSNETKTSSVTATIDFPAIQGGGVLAKTHQAVYNFQVASANQELEYRNSVSQTRQAYLGVLSGISQIKANKQSIISQKSSLTATEAGYIVGTRTIVDVLNAQSDLFSAQKDYTTAEYQYLLDTLTLKEEAGTLSYRDLAQINSWLSKKVSLAVYHKITKTSSFEPEHDVNYTPTVPIVNGKNGKEKDEVKNEKPMTTSSNKKILPKPRQASLKLPQPKYSIPNQKSHKKLS